MVPDKMQPPPAVPQNFHIVGVGASAGGLDAFKKFLKAIPENSGMAYVLVQHLSPNHDSILAEILARETKIPVYEIVDEINLAPDNIYIIPENKILTSHEGVLKLSPRDESPKPNMPIDIFFQSLGEVHKSFAIGVVLSGAAFDGTKGLKSIKEYGGTTIAQDPMTAAFESMPYNAVKSNAVDFVLAPEHIPQQLQLIQNAYVTSYSHSEIDDMPKSDEEIFKNILRMLRLRTGNDFTHYKQATIRRRIARRMVLAKRETPGEYLGLLRSDKAEQDALFNDVLIPVTYFFRDHKIFDALPATVFPLLLKNMQNPERIRIWCAGCSTGEEAYSLAISLTEFLKETRSNIKIQIFATDISENVIAKARSGTYSRHDLMNVSEDRLNRYFKKSGNTFIVDKPIRDMCIFAVHNFLINPPFAKIDLVSCRNVLIYLDPHLQAKALATFHYSLNEDGILILGNAETVANSPTHFTSVLKNERIFMRNNVAGYFDPSPVSQSAETKMKNFGISSISVQRDFKKIAFDILVNKYTPAAVIVNEHKDIVHFHGDTTPYLLQLPGKPNFNILKMAREGLSFELQNTMLKAKNSMQTEIKENLLIKSHNEELLVTIEVIPLAVAEELHFLILFCKSKPPKFKSIEDRREADVARIAQLETELEFLRNDIRTVTEEQEATIEELQSANEELLSTGEELQSLNEELETSAEEIEANNEELSSVNYELVDRQEQLTESINYTEAIISTISQALIILEKDFRIRGANASFYKCFGLSERDIEGKSFFDIYNRQWNDPELKKLLQVVLPKKSRFEHFEIEIDTNDYGNRTFLLNAREIIREKYSDALIMIAIDDITNTKQLKDARTFSAQLEKEVNERTGELQRSESFLQSILNSTNYGIASYEAIRDKANEIVDFRITYTNAEVPANFGLTSEDVTGKTCRDVYPGMFRNGTFEKMLSSIKSGKPESYEISVEINGTIRWLESTIAKVGDSVTITSKNITVEKNSKLHLEAVNKLLANKNKELEQQIFSDFSEGFASYKSGNDFFNSLILDLYLKTKMDYIMLSEVVEGDAGHSVLSFAVAASGKIVDNISYPLSGTPCENILKGKSVSYPRDVAKLFPNYVLVAGYNIESYIGFPLFNANQKCIGMISVMHSEPIRDKAFIESLLKIAARRCEMELERIQNKKTLEEKNAELEKNNKELESFNYIASHDLQEPLRKIQLFYSRILDKDRKNLSAESLEFFMNIDNAATRMQNLIEALLSYSTANYITMTYVKTDLNKLLGEIKVDLAESIASKNATIVYDNLPKISVVPFQFRQLLENLITNALKYSNIEIPPVINITAEQIESYGSNKTKHWKIAVSDNGIGFDPQYKDKIFELFQRLHGKTEYAGTGIGLAICKKIAENHKGHIEVDTTPGKGSVFTVFIPVKI